jgi:hypothetical protein
VAAAITWPRCSPTGSVQLARWAPALRGDQVDWAGVFDGFVAQVDFPGAAFWQQITQAFPDALVVLSTRSAQSWYRSASATIFQLNDDHGSSPFQSCGGSGSATSSTSQTS